MRFVAYMHSGIYLCCSFSVIKLYYQSLSIETSIHLYRWTLTRKLFLRLLQPQIRFVIKGVITPYETETPFEGHYLHFPRVFQKTQSDYRLWCLGNIIFVRKIHLKCCLLSSLIYFRTRNFTYTASFIFFFPVFIQ